MPEISEIRIMSDFINANCKGNIFCNIRKSKESKVKTTLKIDFDYFTIRAESRGKELKLILKHKSGKEKSLIITMGMSGNMVYFLKDAESSYKHCHLILDTIDGYCLGIVDVRRFAKWKWGDWNLNRGPDPIKEYDAFVKNIKKNIDNRVFNKPISEMLMDQKYFNGIGNYLRSEILYRANQNPFEDSRSAITNNKELLKLCKTLSMEAYQLNGGVLEMHEAQYKINNKTFSKWIQCYANPSMSRMTDKTGRTLWYDPKWEKADDKSN